MRNILLAVLAITLAATAGIAVEHESQKPPEQPKQEVQQPALPDYTKTPFSKMADCEGPSGFHPDDEGVTCEVFADNPYQQPGANGIYVFKDKDAKLKYATWVTIQGNGCPVYRAYTYDGKGWVYERDKRPCDDQKKE